MTPALFITKLKKDFPQTVFTIKIRKGVPILFSGKKEIKVDLSAEEIEMLDLAASHSDDAVISGMCDIISARVRLALKEG